MDSLEHRHVYPLESAVLALLPAFVVTKMKDVARKRGHSTFTYHEQTGSIESEDVSKRIAVWLHSTRRPGHWIYQAGSHCWIVPGSHALTFEAIAPEQRPGECDPGFWWAIFSDEGDGQWALHVHKITVVAESEVLDEWEDI